MSINSLANAAAARRPDLVPLSRVPATVEDISIAARTTPVATGPMSAPEIGGPTPVPPQATPPVGGAATVDTAMNVLFGYIPTEVLTLYVAVIAALQKPVTEVAQMNEVTRVTTMTSVVNWMPYWIAFSIFLVGTPLVVWLVFAAKVKAAGRPLPLAWGAWPVWEMFAATLAYVAWSFGLPGSPFGQFAWYSSALSGLAVIVVSTVLGLVAPFFQRPLSA